MGRARKSARLRLEKVTLRTLTSDESAAVVGGVGGGGGKPHGPKEPPAQVFPDGRDLSNRCLG